jgi:GH24 family phage-related lysozyme (muramidase)
MSMPTLRQGSRGQHVRRVQQAVATAGFDPGPVDGVFGPRTRAALRAFQQAKGLQADGIVGPRTWAALLPPEPPNGRPTLSGQGVEFIARFEGFRSKLYNDPAGHCTIGYGHLVHRGRCNGSEPPAFRGGISRQHAAELLRSDAAAAVAAVNDHVTVRLNQAQRDALTSLAYNIGTGGFQGSRLLRRLNAGSYGAVPQELMRWVYAGGRKLPGLVTRRQAEAKLFTTGQYR